MSKGNLNTQHNNMGYNRRCTVCDFGQNPHMRCSSSIICVDGSNFKTTIPGVAKDVSGFRLEYDKGGRLINFKQMAPITSKHVDSNKYEKPNLPTDWDPYPEENNEKSEVKCKDGLMDVDGYITISSKKEMVNHPSHYQSENGVEAIDVIESFTKGMDGIEAFDTGNIIKYILRWKQKNGIEDLKKVIWYTEHLISHIEKINDKK